MIALLLGTVLTLAALALVLQPLFRESTAGGLPVTPEPHARPEDSDTARALAALREVEFDRETGKLSAEDYEELKASYTQEAVQAMRREQPAGNGPLPGDDELEEVIRRQRAMLSSAGTGAAPVCASCGPRPESDAAYCSNCGRYLAERCPTCAAPVDEPGARFCASCGGALHPPRAHASAAG